MTAVIENRKAKFKYQILNTVEVGLQLTGTEIKSIRAGNVSIAEAYVTVRQGELYLTNANIAPYTHGNIYNHAPTRPRKCLANKTEIIRLISQIEEKGLTLVPLKLYFKKRWLKCLVGVARGKKQHDKRQSIKERDLQRESQRAIRQAQKSR